MFGIQYLTFLWILFVTQTRFVCSEIQFLERNEGESVVLPCVTDERRPPPYGVYLKRSWLQKADVLFMHTKSEFYVNNSLDRKRVNVRGDPSDHSLDVTISQLRVSDTDRYYCEFIIDNPGAEDERIGGNTEFFLLVSNANVLVDIELVKTCAGGSAVLPCLPPSWDNWTVDGVSLNRQQGRAPVEVLYNSKRPNGDSARFATSQFSDERVRLLSAPGPDGITYNITLRQLQPEDSGLYSCQLLVHGRPDTVTGLGRRVFFVSVEDSTCSSCSSYSTLLYIVPSVGFVLIVVVIIGFVVIHKGRARHCTNVHSQAPIYEDMTRVRAFNQKMAGDHLEEMESSEYTNCPMKKSYPGNHYESPRGSLCPKT